MLATRFGCAGTLVESDDQSQAARSIPSSIGGGGTLLAAEDGSGRQQSLPTYNDQQTSVDKRSQYAQLLCTIV